MNTFKRYFLIRFLITVLFGAALGAFFLLMSPYASELLDIIVIAMGLLTAVLNIPGVCLSLAHIRERGVWVHLLLSVGAVTLGILLILLHRTVILVLLAIYSFCFPLLRILLVKERKKQLLRELPTVFVGLAVILVILSESEHIVMKALAVACFAVTAIYLIYGLLVLHFRFGAPKSKERTIEGEFREKE